MISFQDTPMLYRSPINGGKVVEGTDMAIAVDWATLVWAWAKQMVTGQLVPKSTRTHFGQHVPELTRTQVNSYLSIFNFILLDLKSLPVHHP